MEFEDGLKKVHEWFTENYIYIIVTFMEKEIKICQKKH